MPDSPYGWWLPPDISTHGSSIDTLISILHWFMAAIFVGWLIFFVVCLVRFRARSGHKATYDPPKGKVAKYAEVVVALFEFFLLFGLSVPVWGALKTEFPGADKDPLRVRVVAEQFQWNMHYPGPDGVFGRTAPEFMDSDNLVGLDSDDPAAGDDVISTEFHLVVDRPVIVTLTSKDVIHSFSIPVMRIKQDTIPGMAIPVWFEATETGQYQIACAQLCGNNHYRMSADLFVETAEEFEDWYAEAASGDDEEEEEE
jgi:cytochrome c oxidase subunit II